MKLIAKNRKSRAFTLIELMVVILILAILAALIIPKVVGRTDEAKRAKAASDIKTLEGALDAYKLDNDKYPTSEQGLNALRRDPGDAKNWKPYIQKDIPTDPWQNEYFYESDGNDYVLKSYGADGVEGGDGNDLDIGGDQSD
jgi:general secretion pathway protein G